ncbi:MAG: hypothetical protein R2824_34800 [Saprospiraceae bacterium]|nr:hypothetical protein [Lewinella sp.]
MQDFWQTAMQVWSPWEPDRVVQEFEDQNYEVDPLFEDEPEEEWEETDVEVKPVEEIWWFEL